jgi:two-component system LytT family sensor kinase
MAELYRRVLRLPERGTVALREELAMVRSYLEIEQVRMGKRLSFSLEGEPEALDTMVPPLLVQPLVENAVLHGIGPLPEGGVVRLTASRRDGSTVITVSDSGAGFSSDRGSEGFGLESVSERMRLRYGSRGAMRILSPPSGGTTIELEIPDAVDGPDRRG